MKTLADFKKKIAVGVKLHTIYHQASAGRDEKGVLLFKDEDKGTREISISQSTQFALKTKKTDGTFVDSWIKFPKATECVIIDENTIQILERDFRVHENAPLIPVLTYKFVA